MSCCELTDAVLVIDDEKLLREMVVMMLKMIGFAQILETADCNSAIGLAQEWSQNLKLIITDMRMPMCSGAELACELHRQHPGAKFLLISGDSNDLQDPLATLADCALGLPKPFTFKELSERVQVLMQRST